MQIAAIFHHSVQTVWVAAPTSIEGSMGRLLLASMMMLIITLARLPIFLLVGVADLFHALLHLFIVFL